MLGVFSPTARHMGTDLNFSFAVERSILALFSHAIKDTQSVPKSEILVAEMIFTASSKSKNRFVMRIVLVASLVWSVDQDIREAATFRAYYQLFAVCLDDSMVSSRHMDVVVGNYSKPPKERHLRGHLLPYHNHK